MNHCSKILFWLLLIFLFQSCKKKDGQQGEIRTHSEKGIENDISVNETYANIAPLKLSDYGFFTGKLSELVPAKNVLPYDINSPLFSDYALKKRFIFLPAGAKIGYRDRQVFDFPVGTVLIKNFYYENDQLSDRKGRIIETRLLVHKEKGWEGFPYIWNKEQTEAFLEITGGTTYLSLINQKEAIAYSIPNIKQCKSCHELNGEMMPIGPSARQLNKDFNYSEGKMNQLMKLSKIEWLNGLPDLSSVEKLPYYFADSSGTLGERARAYLEINCAHCHRPGGPAKNSGLNLTYHNTDLFSLGIDKAPVAAGKGSGDLRYDIVPGAAEESIITFRMSTTDPGIMMPELGRKTIHKEGVLLIKEWINSLGRD